METGLSCPIQVTDKPLVVVTDPVRVEWKVSCLTMSKVVAFQPLFYYLDDDFSNGNDELSGNSNDNYHKNYHHYRYHVLVVSCAPKNGGYLPNTNIGSLDAQPTLVQSRELMQIPPDSGSRWNGSPRPRFRHSFRTVLSLIVVCKDHISYSSRQSS